MIRDPMLVESVLEPAVQTVTPKEPAERKTAWITVSVLIGAGVVLGLGGLTPASIYAGLRATRPRPKPSPLRLGSFSKRAIWASSPVRPRLAGSSTSSDGRPRRS